MLTYDDLAEAIDVPKQKLTYFAYAVSDDKKYVKFSIPKRSGGERIIHAPIKPLKQIQRKIADMLREKYLRDMPFSNHGYGNSKDIITNASAHFGKRYIFKCDIADFYTSIEGGRIFRVLTSKAFGMSDEVAHIITKLCTYCGFLPQGAPSSPIISNIIARRLDIKLMRYAKHTGGIYTRYADDITFSYPTIGQARRCIDSDNRITRELDDILLEEGFNLNARKSRLMTRRGRQLVTGIIINEKLNVKRSYIKELRDLLYILNKYGLFAAQSAFNRKHLGTSKNVIKTIEGRLLHIRRIRGDDDVLYLKLATEYTKYKSEYISTEKIEKEAGKLKSRILAEGKTDYIHLKAALDTFHSVGKFKNLDIDLTPHDNIEGWSDLDEYVKKSRGVKLGGLHIAVFDSDESKINTKYPDRFHKITDYLYVFRLPLPQDLSDGSLYCIEMLYKDFDLKRVDGNGRRLYFTSEFNSNDYSNKYDPCVVCNQISWNKLVVDGKVFRIIDGVRVSVGLSKSDFAEHMQTTALSANSPDFSNFEEVFRVVEEISKDFENQSLDNTGQSNPPQS